MNEKPTKRLTHAQFFDVVNGLHANSDEFAHDLIVIKREDGSRIWGERDKTQKTIVLLDPIRVREYLVQFGNKELLRFSFQMDMDEAKKCEGYLLACMVPFKEPIKSVAELSDPSYCYHRLEFDAPPSLVERDNCPNFMEFVGRCTNQIALCAWFGSLFYEDADLSQYLFVNGDGGDGKGSAAECLEKALGGYKGIYIKKSMPRYDSIKDTFIASLEGRRLCYFAECDHLAFVVGESFKNMTGGRSMDARQLFGKPYNVNLACKYLVTSNAGLEIPDTPAHRRRCIYVEVSQPKTGIVDATVKPAMVGETPAIIAYCKAIYESICPKHGVIATEKKSFEILTCSYHEDMEAFFNRWFEFKENGIVDASLLPTVFAYDPDPPKRRDFLKWLREIGGARVKLSEIHLKQRKHLGIVIREKKRATLGLYETYKQNNDANNNSNKGHLLGDSGNDSN